jgi:sugar phosphate isomerase/epimerase
MSAAACAVAASPLAVSQAATDSPARGTPSDANPFRFGMNTATLRGQKLPIAELVEVVAKAGFQAIEPWISELEEHSRRGGSLKDLGKKIRDLGMTVESSIGFAEWIVDDDARRAKGLEHARRDMDLVAQVGGLRMAAPPAGATNEPRLDPARVAERYRKLLELGDQIGVVPEVEVWGFSKTLTRLSDAAEVALMTGHPKACILPDIYHLYKGGSPFAGLRLLSGQVVHVIHTNDYPANPPRATIKDSDRVFPGDGVAPLAVIFRDMRDAGFRGTLSIELFNPTYWQQDPHTVARTALAKTRAIVADALAAT